MNPEPLLVSDVLGRTVRDRLGRPLGRIADLVADDDHRISAVIVVRGRWGRLLGYKRHEQTGPWLLDRLGDYVLRRDTTQVPWHDVQL